MNFNAFKDQNNTIFLLCNVQKRTQNELHELYSENGKFDSVIKSIDILAKSFYYLFALFERLLELSFFICLYVPLTILS